MPRGSNLKGKPKLGRPAGTPNKATQHRLERARAQGPLPFDALIYGMNYKLKRHQDELSKGPQADLKAADEHLHVAMAYATAAAPYCHPRLTAIGIKDWKDLRAESERIQNAGEHGQTITVTDYRKLTEAELLRLAREKLAEG